MCTQYMQCNGSDVCDLYVQNMGGSNGLVGFCTPPSSGSGGEGQQCAQDSSCNTDLCPTSQQCFALCVLNGSAAQCPRNGCDFSSCTSVSVTLEGVTTQLGTCDVSGC
jgi:hypothetical protein